MHKLGYLSSFIYSVIFLCISFFLMPDAAFSQCSNAKPTILETFGAGTPQYNTTPATGFGFTTTYSQENGGGTGARTNDGEFSFVNRITDYWNVWHGGVTDHTGDPGGYMMLVNASFDPGEFYHDTVSGLCIGVTYEFSVWMGNIDDIATGRINPDVRFEIRDANTGTLLADYETGDVLASATQFTWRKHALSFVTTAEEVVLLLINNNPGGSGNDIVLDDIAFTPCLPTYRIDSKTQYCFQEEMVLSIDQQGTPFGTEEYLWQKKNNLGVWEDIGQNVTEITVSVSTPADSGWYKLLVAETGKLGSPNCRSEDSIYIDVHPPLIPGKIESDQNICYGTSPAEFTNLITPTGSDGNFTFTWEKSTDNVTWTSANEHGLNYTDLSLLTTETYYRRQVSTVCDIGYSDTVTVAITPSVTPGAIEADQDLCYGLSPSIFAETTPAAGGLAPYQYEWEYSDDSIIWVPIPATNSTTYQSPDISNDRWFRRNIKDSKCAATDGVYSNPVKLIYLRSKEPIVRDTVFCQQNGNFNPTATGSGLLWYPTSASATGSPTIAPLDLSVPGTYTYFVTQTITGCVSPKSEFSVVVNPKPDLTSSDDKICLGIGAELSTTVSNYTGTLSYNWSPATGLTDTDADKTMANPGSTTLYTIMVEDSRGCRDTTTVNLTVFPKPDLSTNNYEICKGLDTLIQTSISNTTGTVNYIWIPTVGLSSATDADVTASPSVSTTYTVYANDSEGCKDTATVDVTVNTKPVLTANDIVICNGLSAAINTSISNHTGIATYLWTPSTGLSSTTGASAVANPTSSTIYTVYTEDSKGCKDTVTVNATVNPKPVLTANNGSFCEGNSVGISTGISNLTGVATYSWTPVNGIDDPISSSVTANPASTTTYTIIATDNAGCKDTTTSTVTVNPNPIVAIKGGDVCGNNITLQSEITNSTGLLNYLWSPSTGLSVTNTATVNVVPSAKTTYTLTVTDANLCQGSQTTVVMPKPILTVNSGSICEGKSTSINTGITNYTGIPTYSWKPVTGIDNFTNSSVTANPSSTTTYTIIATDSEGCKDTITSTVTVHPKPEVLISGEDICGGSYADLVSTVNNYTGTITYKWTPTVGLNQANTSSVRATVLQTTTYTLIVSDANLCADTTAYTVGVTTKPNAQILQSDTIICKDETLTLEAYNDLNEDYTFTWYLSEDSGPGNIVGSSNTLNITKPGYYLVEVRNEGFCPVFSERIKVDIEDIFVEAVANKTILYYDEILELKAIGSAEIMNYQWTSTQGNSTLQQFSLYPQKDDTYTITAAGQKCKDSDEVFVKILPPIIIPNGFSPNGDSKNDQWIITGLESYPQAIVKIFNRWGNIVYEYTNGYYEPWNGLSRSGLDLPSATYYYIIEVKDLRKQTYNGSVTILK